MTRLRLGILLLLLAAGGVALVMWAQRSIPRLSERQVREAVYATLQREADTSFVVTGYVDMVVTTRAEDTRVLLPNILDLSLGTTRATVRVPGRVSYGFDLSRLRPEMIHLVGDTVEVEIPELATYSVEPDLARMEVETSTGWARFRITAQETERVAVQRLGEALRAQGDAYLRDAVQPRMNTARTLQQLVTPTLEAMGMADPHFRIRIGDGMVVEATGEP